MKLGNPFIGNNFKITQTLHSFDNAIDCIGDTFDLYAVWDMQINGQEHDGQTPWFRGFYNGMEIRYVHSILFKPGYFKKGEKIGTYKVPTDPFPDHLHISVRYNGQWLNFMEYLDRSINLQLSSGFTNNQQFYKNWLTWSDKKLPFTNNTMNVTTSQYSSLSLIARDLFKLPNWTEKESWEVVLKYNEHLRTGDYNTIPAGVIINVPDAAELIIDDKELDKVNKELEELRRKNQELLDKQLQLSEQAEKRLSELKAKSLEELNDKIAHYEEKLLEARKKINQLEKPHDYNLERIIVPVLEEAKARGLKKTWHKFIDRNFKSNYVRSVLKYDWFMILFSAASLVYAVSQTELAQTPVLGLIISVLGAQSLQVMKYILTNYDKNRDGEINQDDSMIPQEIGSI